MYSVEIAVTDQLSYAEVEMMAESFDCTTVSLNEVEEATGSPMYRFSAENKQSVINLVVDFYWMDTEDAENMVIYS